jgi:hypothetical protein
MARIIRAQGLRRSRERAQRLRAADLRPELRLDLRAEDFLEELFVERPVAELRAVRRCDELLFFALLFFALVLLALDFFAPDFFAADFLRGTLAPSRRASERPIAMACLRLVTFLPLRPLLSWPRFISCISSRTFSPALGL